MATAMIYDTLKLPEQLEREAGFEAARARAMARVLAENTAGNLVTREDLLVTKGELQATIQSVRSELESVRSDLGARIGALDGKVRVLYWMTGTTLAGVAAILGTAITMALHFMHLE